MPVRSLLLLLLLLEHGKGCCGVGRVLLVGE
jgi:hypothetical protein